MDTRIIEVEGQKEALSLQEETEIREAGELLRRGGLVAFPTETVYGLGGDALNPESSRKIYKAKGRPSDNPLIVHIYRFEDIYPIVEEVPEEAVALARAFWPGPLTMILPKSSLVPRETTGGLDTVAIRLPSHPVARKLIEYAGGYVAAPSANVSGKPSPTRASHVAEDLTGRIEAIVDGGEVGIGLESTIVDLSVSPPQILRPGYITTEMLAEVLGQVEADRSKDGAEDEKGPKAPGMKYRHYAPMGELTIIQGDPEQVRNYINSCAERDRMAGERVGILCSEETSREYSGDVVKILGSRQDEEGIARHLYGCLREFDREKATKIYSESFEVDGFGRAIMNRLLKAAGHKVIRLQKEKAREEAKDGSNRK